ncbi:hypothetical protein AAHA92_24172 [Salvia divinorum]|uniref:Myb/SANT-like domain-containing protein n=1 Tax=Salvia divinorum TaxID=28513 RepID=A0ABD1G6H7_SALDI
MADKIHNQSFFLYESNCTPAIDSLLVGTILRLKQSSRWDGTVFPSHFILQAEAAIEHELGYAFEWSDLYDRLHFLEKRYKTFKEILEMQGTYWNAHTNTLIVMDQAWSELLQRNPLVGAYHNHGDPCYYELAMLFDYNAVKVERENTIIMISDSMESTAAVPVAENAPPRVRHAGEVPKIDPVARRKLLFEERKPPDLESINNRGQHFYVTDKDGNLVPKNEDVLPSCVLHGNTPSKSPTYSESGASSSPIMWWRMPRKPT